MEAKTYYGDTDYCREPFNRSASKVLFKHFVKFAKSKVHKPDCDGESDRL